MFKIFSIKFFNSHFYTFNSPFATCPTLLGQSTNLLVSDKETSEYFEKVDDVPFMEKVFQFKDEKKPKLSAVVHVDGSGRLQTVDKEIEPKYYNLIDTIRKKTATPILLNTSFNENEPIVNTPKEAYECFARTSMDMVVMGNIVVTERK